MGRRKKPQNVQMLGENKTEIVNDTKALSIVPGQPTEKAESRERLLIRNLFLGMPIKEAAQKAGYSETYTRSNLYDKWKSPRFQNKVKDFAVSMNYSFLPKVFNIHKLGLEAIEDDLKNGGTEKACKLKHITKQTLQMSGILADENQQPAVSYVNIQSLQMLITDKLNRNGSGEDTKD